MNEKRRVFLVVLDSVGAGEAPDAASFGDIGVHTLRSVWETGKLHIPNLVSLGIGNIEGLSFLENADAPLASVARMREQSAGKDTTVGHWEIAGHISHRPLPTFPNGFPDDLIERFSKTVGRTVLCNKPYSGTEVLKDYGEEHMRTGALIVYTSADSVFQIAAHTGVVPLEELYDICEKARNMLVGPEYGVGRVIARPFDGCAPSFKRTPDRRDFSIMPPSGLLADAIIASGLDSIAVGKISDIFAGRGFTESYPTHSNGEGIEVLLNLAKRDFLGLCFVNLVEFDSLWGHRRDAVGYANGLNAFDRCIPCLLSSLDEKDLLIITADHGCDPSYLKTTDHTREFTPMICYSKSISPKNLGTRDTFADIAATVAFWLGIELESDGVAFDIENT